MAFTNDSRGGVLFDYPIDFGESSTAIVTQIDGTKIKDLWENRFQPHGTYSEKWHGDTDDYTLSENGNYNVIIDQIPEIQEEWNAVIGNTSKYQTGDRKHRAYRHPFDMLELNGYVYYVTGGNERTTGIFRFPVNDIQDCEKILSFDGKQMYPEHLATDGSRIYIGGYDGWSGNIIKPSFLIAIDPETLAQVSFPSGVKFTVTGGVPYNSAIAVETGGKSTGLTCNDEFIYVSYSTLNIVKVFNKDGTLVNTLPFTAPKQIRINGDDCRLLHSTTIIEQFAVEVDGSLTTTGALLPDLVKPLNFVFKQDGSEIAVADKNDNYDIVRFYSSEINSLTDSLGGNESYTVNNNVRFDKFWWGNCSLCYESNGTFWVGDGGNYRIQHFQSDKSFTEDSNDFIMFLDTRYSCRVNKTNPNQISSEWQIFEVTYSPFTWKYTKNYLPSVPSEYVREQYGTFRNLTTFPSGRTYAIITVYGGDKHRMMCELPEDGPLRITGLKLSVDIREDGGIILYKRPSSFTGGVVCTARDLINEDGLNPEWGPEYDLFRLPESKEEDPIQFGTGASQGLKTADDRFVTFEQNANKYGYKLGFIKDNKFVVKCSKSTDRGYIGPFPTNGWFDEGNSVKDTGAGGNVYVVGNFIFWNYPGENWKAGQTNYWNIYNSDGMFIYRFGTDQTKVSGRSPAKMAGNVKAGGVCRVGDDYYIYHNDESQHSAVHRWKISGLHSITRKVVPVSLNVTGQGLLRKDYSGKDFDLFKLSSTSLTPTVNLTALNSVNSYVFDGFIKPLYSETYNIHVASSGGVRVFVKVNLSVNNLPIIDQFSNTTQNEFTGTVGLKSGVYYPIRVECLGENISLSWSSLSQEKELIPSIRIRPAVSTDLSKGYPLLTDLDFSKIIDNIYGHQRFPLLNSASSPYVWDLSTYRKRYDTPDLFIKHRSPNGTNYWHTRNINPSSNVLGWKIYGIESFDENFANRDNNGQFFEIIDINGRFIFKKYIKVGGLGFRYHVNEGVIANASSLPDIRNLNAFEITCNADGITFTHEAYGSITVALFDPLALWNKPVTLKQNYVTVNRDETRAISLSELYYKEETDIVIEPPVDPPVDPIGPTIKLKGRKFRLSAFPDV